MLADKIQEDAITVLKQHNAQKVSILRFISSEIKNQEIDSQKRLDDNEVIVFIKKEVNNLQAACFRAERVGRNDLAQVEGSLRSAFHYVGGKNLSEFFLKSRFVKISRAWSFGKSSSLGHHQKPG